MRYFDDDINDDDDDDINETSTAPGALLKKMGSGEQF